MVNHRCALFSRFAVLLLAVALFGCSGQSQAITLDVDLGPPPDEPTFYGGILPLAQKHCVSYPGRVVLRRVDCTSDEGVAAVARYGFRSHGLVLLDRAAHPQLVESDHRVFPEHVAEALARILPAAPPP